MGLFQKSESYLGVDIGTGSIKACELENRKGRAALLTYGYTNLPNDLIRSDKPETIKAVTLALKQIVEQAHVRTQKVIAGLPAYAVFTFEADLPKAEPKELEPQIRAQAERSLPVPITEMVVDWEVIEEVIFESPEKRTPENYLRILITAAPRALVAKYSRIFAGAGLVLESLETETMALIRSLVGTDKAPTLILDIGATATDVSLVDGGFPRLSKGVEIGGNLFTESIAKSLNVSLDRAEQFKKDFGLQSVSNAVEIPERVKAVADTLANEVRKVLNIFYDKRSKKVERIILAGGSARLKGLDRYLEQLLEVKVYLGNPWARVIAPARLESSLQKIGAEFAVTVGLAMRNLT